MKPTGNKNLKLKLKFAQKVLIIVALCSIALNINMVQAKTDSFLMHDYETYFSEFDQILLYKPDFIKDVFHGLINLKGKPSNSRNYINYEVLGCHSDSRINQACRITQLSRKRRALGIKSTIEIPLDYTNISARYYNKYKKVVTLKWKPALITPPHMSLNSFLTYLNAAEDSKYYRLKKGIDRIQLNILFEREVNVIIENSLSNNLSKLYQQLKTDKRDSLTFVFDYLTSSIRNNTIHYFIHFKIKKVKINHQSFIASERRL